MQSRPTLRLARPAALAALVPLLAACGSDEPDAYGTFEAREVVVSAEVGGRLVRFAAAEGERLGAGAAVGEIETTASGLQREELLAQRGAARSRTVEAQGQVRVLLAQLATAREEHARTLRLFRDEAATARQLETAAGEVRVLEERIAAARARTELTHDEAEGLEARILQVDDRIARGQVHNPVAGTVLTTYARAGELVQPGQPLYRVADLDTLTLRAYVSGAQLAGLRVGGEVRVRYDGAEGGLATLPGRVAWIGAEAEFTPTPIQTRDERTALVYPVRIRVANPGGVLRIGMPGEVVFAAEAGASRP
jgi:HlyD family secretion protein